IPAATALVLALVLLPIGLNLLAQLFDFCRQALVFGLFAGQKTLGRSAFGGDAGRGEFVQVSAFVFAVFEVGGLDVAFVQQGFEAVVDLADANAEFLGQLALGHAGVGFQV